MRGHQFSLHVSVYSILVFLGRTIDIVLALHTSYLSFLSFCTYDQICHVGSSEVLIILDKDSHLFFFLITISQIPVEEADGQIYGLLVSCRVVRFVNILQLLYSRAGSLIELHHILTFYALVHQRCYEENRLVDTADVPQWL